MMLLIPAIIFGMLIFFMSVTVISMSNRTKVEIREKEFGIIKYWVELQNRLKETVILKVFG